MRPARIIGVLAVLTPPAMSARFQCLPDQAGAGEEAASFPTWGSPACWRGETLGFPSLKAYPLLGLAEGDEQARDRNELAARTKMAAGKKTSDDADNMLATNPATDPVGAGCARIDDIPDRLLILANRLQKALDSRRAVAGDGGRSDLKKNLRHPVNQTENKK